MISREWYETTDIFLSVIEGGASCAGIMCSDCPLYRGDNNMTNDEERVCDGLAGGW